MKRKVSYFVDNDIFSGKKIKYAKVIIFNEPMDIKGLKFKMNNIYNVPAENVNDTNLYVQPIHNPNYNINKAFHIYRQKMGLMNPKEIKIARKHYGLSQRDISAILGMSYSTLSRIESGKIVQSVSQDTELRTLLNKRALARLILARLTTIKVKKPKRVKLQKLVNTAKKMTV